MCVSNETDDFQDKIGDQGAVIGESGSDDRRTKIVEPRQLTSCSCFCDPEGSDLCAEMLVASQLSSLEQFYGRCGIPGCKSVALPYIHPARMTTPAPSLELHDGFVSKQVIIYVVRY